jgi:hypothetical protein
MRLSLGLIVCGALGASAFPSEAPASPKAPETRVRRFALILSSNDGGRDRAPLRFADTDATAVAEVLRSLGGLRSDDLLVVTGARRASLQSSFERIRGAIAQAAKAKARRELIVYYSGHSDEQGLLMGGERVSYRELRQWIDGTNAEVRIAILDSCASGALIRLRGGALRPSFLNDVSTNARGHAFLTSSSADEAAQESDRIGAAFFTHFLVSGLRGAADTSRDGLVTLAEAYQFAFHETLGRTEQTGAGPQHPAYDIQLAGTGDLVLTDLRANTANLVLDEKVAGRVYVRDTTGRLLVELRKEPTYPVQLGLGPGRYKVIVDADGRAFEASITLQEGKATRLGQPQLALAPLQPTVARGDVPAPAETKTAPPPTTVAALALARRPALGAYAGVTMRYGRLDGRDGFFAGGEVGLIFDHRYIIGLAGVGGSLGDAADPGGSLSMGFAALALRYRFQFDASPVDLTAGVIAGPGGVDRERQGMPDQDGMIFVFEPQLEANVNLARWLRVGADLGYRFVAAGEAVSTSGLRGVTAGVHAQLGWF